jgi:acyl-CoA hydrolase
MQRLSFTTGKPYLLIYITIMTTEERIKDAESRIFKTVFPSDTNHYDTLFGGSAMAMMDEVAFITATRFTRKRMVTVSSDRIDFKRPIPTGTIIELVGSIAHIGNTSLKVSVEIYIEEMYSFVREKAITGTFTFVAIDEHKHPISVL